MRTLLVSRAVVVGAIGFLLSTQTLADTKPGSADAKPVEIGALARIDAAFGDWFVSPVATVLFYDAVFWDNEVEPSTLIGSVVDGRRVVGYDEEKGFQTEVPPARYSGGELRLLVSHDEVKTENGVNYHLSDTGGGRVIVTVVAGPFAPMADVRETMLPYSDRHAQQFGFTDDDGTKIAPRDGLFIAGTSGPFPFLVEVTEPPAPAANGAAPIVDAAPPMNVLSARVKVARSPWLVAGTMVKIPGEKDGHVLAALSDNQFEVQANDKVYDATLKPANPKNVVVPIIVLWLVIGSIFFTLRFGFINIRGFFHAIRVVKGDYDVDGAPGEISHFQALSSALSATVGLGNIAGVAIAVAQGGPGAVFWMIVAGFFGMTAKFTECTLGQMYRVIDGGVVSGGPMRYLKTGLAEVGLGRLGKGLAVLFTFLCIGGSFGGGNMFQSNQAAAAIVNQFPSLAPYRWVLGIAFAVLVALVIIGGIKRIAGAASVVVPVMCGVYVLAGLAIILSNISEIPVAAAAIIDGAFTLEAGFGGLMGTLVVGFKRAAFSNEAGVGSAAIAHSAAATSEPVREGLVGLLEPFIDTIMICAMTGIVVVITGVYSNDYGPNGGVQMTNDAFASVLPWFPPVLTFIVFLFAFSTMISWSYYGERCWTLIFGPSSSLAYRIVFCIVVFFGAVFELGNVLTFSDLMILGMAFPNILGCYILSNKVKEHLDDYWSRYKAGNMATKGR